MGPSLRAPLTARSRITDATTNPTVKMMLSSGKAFTPGTSAFAWNTPEAIRLIW